MCCGRLQSWLAPRGGVSQCGLEQAGREAALPGVSSAPCGGLGPCSPGTDTHATAGSSRNNTQHAPKPLRDQGFVPQRTGIPVSGAINSAPAPGACTDLWLLQSVLPRHEPFITHLHRYPVTWADWLSFDLTATLPPEHVLPPSRARPVPALFCPNPPKWKQVPARNHSHLQEWVENSRELPHTVLAHPGHQGGPQALVAPTLPPNLVTLRTGQVMPGWEAVALQCCWVTPAPRRASLHLPGVLARSSSNIPWQIENPNF